MIDTGDGPLPAISTVIQLCRMRGLNFKQEWREAIVRARAIIAATQERFDVALRMVLAA